MKQTVVVTTPAFVVSFTASLCPSYNVGPSLTSIMIRLLPALAVIVSLSSVVIFAEDDATPAMDFGNLGTDYNNMGNGYYDRACQYVRCARGFQCISSRSNYGYSTPKCVLDRVDCEDLTGDDDWNNWDSGFSDEAQPSADEAPAADRRRQSAPRTCRRDYDCNRNQGGNNNNNNYYQASEYKCCRLRGDYDRRCLSVPSYIPEGRN